MTVEKKSAFRNFIDRFLRDFFGKLPEGYGETDDTPDLEVFKADMEAAEEEIHSQKASFKGEENNISAKQ